ncbi:MAG: hypothetical protein AB1765_09715 [Candidatus Hydrogenedentota bacterium]
MNKDKGYFKLVVTKSVPYLTQNEEANRIRSDTTFFNSFSGLNFTKPQTAFRNRILHAVYYGLHNCNINNVSSSLFQAKVNVTEGINSDTLIITYIIPDSLSAKDLPDTSEVYVNIIININGECLGSNGTISGSKITFNKKYTRSDINTPENLFVYYKQNQEIPAILETNYKIIERDLFYFSTMPSAESKKLSIEHLLKSKPGSQKTGFFLKPELIQHTTKEEFLEFINSAIVKKYYGIRKIYPVHYLNFDYILINLYRDWDRLQIEEKKEFISFLSANQKNVLKNIPVYLVNSDGKRLIIP